VCDHRGSGGLEVDIIVRTTDAWGLSRSLGVSRVDRATASLLSFARTGASTEVAGPPTLAVTTGDR